MVAGAFWSVVGPGRNLQPSAEAIGYYFHWTPEETMLMFDENAYPGRFPEPVTLAAWVDGFDGTASGNGVVLSCHYSENAVSYQLLLGSDAHRVAHYQIVSETPVPPQDAVKNLPSGDVWWTIRVRDRYGSTIYADPIPLDLTNLRVPSIGNVRTGKRYGLIEHAILEAERGDDIVLEPGTYQESIEFGATPVAIRSLDPNASSVVAGTIIKAQGGGPAVTFPGPESGACTLDGLTIQSETVGISCRDAAPTIRNCIVGSPDGIAIEFWWGREPILMNCILLGQVREGGDPGQCRG